MHGVIHWGPLTVDPQIILVIFYCEPAINGDESFGPQIFGGNTFGLPKIYPAELPLS